MTIIRRNRHGNPTPLPYPQKFAGAVPRTGLRNESNACVPNPRNGNGSKYDPVAEDTKRGRRQ